MKMFKCAINTLLFIFVLYTLGVRFNVTPSLPLGLWLKSGNRNAEYVEFCVPMGEAHDVAVQRGYFSSGLCPGGNAPLLKPVAARYGDVVIINGSEMTINYGAPYLIFQEDRLGRKMPQVKAGVYEVQEDEIWVLSDYNPRSFDSRYFGPVKVMATSGMKPLWTMDVKEQ